MYILFWFGLVWFGLGLVGFDDCRGSFLFLFFSINQRYGERAVPPGSAQARDVATVLYHLHDFDPKKSKLKLDHDPGQAKAVGLLAGRSCFLKGGLRLADMKGGGGGGGGSVSGEAVAEGDSVADKAGGAAAGKARQARQSPPSPSLKPRRGQRGLGPMLHLVRSTASSLAGALMAARSFTRGKLEESQSEAAAAEKSQSEPITLRDMDPRFLVFEFMSGFMLRKRQCVNHICTAPLVYMPQTHAVHMPHHVMAEGEACIPLHILGRGCGVSGGSGSRSPGALCRFLADLVTYASVCFLTSP